MEAEQRKERFITVLKELLTQTGGVKAKLAKKLEINPSTLTRWLQGQVDPVTLDLVNFVRLSEIANLSSDELAKRVGISPNDEIKVLNKFKKIIEDLLSSQSLEQLGNKIGVTYSAISNWVTSDKGINPERIPVGTIAALAKEKGWTLERLLIYLDLKEAQTEDDSLFKLQSNVNVLSLNERLKLLAWLSERVQQEIRQKITINKGIKSQINRRVCVVIEQENITVISSYASNLVLHLHFQPENIKIATIPTLPDSLEDIDVLIFDISNVDSPSLALIQDIEFDGNIVIFSAIDLPEEVRNAIAPLVTDVVMKPVDWQQLKEKEYFA